MSLSVVRRPIFLAISSTTAVAATASDSSGDVLITKATHGKSTGNYIYIYSEFYSYNGFWYVEVIDPNTFKIREYPTASFVEFINSGSVEYYPVSMSSTTTYIAVHTPVIFKLQSNVWPVNGVDTARTVSSFVNYNGYTALSLSGTLHTGSTVLESVTIVGTSSLDGVYRIINWFSASSIVIDLAYSASNSFSGGTVQYYYMNYHAVVRVYAGLESGHTWYDQKPMELVAEIKCLPDATGLITVNISEYLKKQIGILSNNLLLDTLPNNIDAFCQFYIEHAESYDDSDGYTVQEVTQSFTSDQANFLGRAINAKFPFKSRHINILGEYAGTASGTALLLTPFTSPTLTPGKYFDVSFLVGALVNPIVVNRTVYVEGVAKETFQDTLAFEGIGVYRYPISQSGWSEDQIVIEITVGGVQQYVDFTIDVDNDCHTNSVYLTWLNYLGGFDYWNFTARSTTAIDIEDSQVQEKNIFPGWPKSYGEFADTIRQQTSRKSRKSVNVQSGHLTEDQVEAIRWILSSPLVQIVTSQYDRRTVIVEQGNFNILKDDEKIFTLSFTISYTDELPAQSL